MSENADSAQPPPRPKPWSEMAPQLVDVAMGRKPADLVVRNARWVNVYSGEIIRQQP